MVKNVVATYQTVSYTQASFTSLYRLLGQSFMDIGKITLGPACVAERTADTTDADYEVAIELYFDMPPGQSGFLGESFARVHK